MNTEPIRRTRPRKGQRDQSRTAAARQRTVNRQRARALKRHGR